MRNFKTAFFLICMSLCAGCGGTKNPAATTQADSLPPCANVTAAVGLPSDFPTDFPLPAGTVITSSQRSQTNSTTISGAIPMRFKEAVGFFQSKLPAAGYELLEGDAEMDEAESTFAGKGFRGKWKINGILNCPAAVRLTLAIGKS